MTSAIVDHFYTLLVPSNGEEHVVLYTLDHVKSNVYGMPGIRAVVFVERNFLKYLVHFFSNFNWNIYLIILLFNIACFAW